MPPLEMVKVPPCISSSAELAVARADTEIGDRRLDLGEAHAVGVAQYRHNEAALGADGDADMVIVLVNDILAVDLGVDRGDILQRLHRSLNEEAHQPELHAVLLLEGVAIVAAKLHHALISTSLNVVSMAALSCASLSRLAMVWRSRVMRTRSSRAMHRPWSLAHAALVEPLPCARARAAPRRLCAGTSCFSTWPRRPEPFTSLGAMPRLGEQLAGSGRGRHIVAAYLLAAHRLALE